MSDNKTSSGGIGFTSLLLLAFIILKLCHVIDWSWWWVLSPLWIGFAIATVALSVYVLILFAESKKAKKKLQDTINRMGTTPPPKSKWQERYEQMRENQSKLKK